MEYIPYPKAIGLLSERLRATPHDLAVWVWLGPKDGGIAAYLNAKKSNHPSRFYYELGDGNTSDYLSPLKRCWFLEKDITNFTPRDHYITGKALIKRWSNQASIRPDDFIRVKISRSRLLDIHPIFGGTRGSFADQSSFPPLEDGLFPLSQIERIERLDFGVKKYATTSTNSNNASESEGSIVGSPEWRRRNAQMAIEARHNKPGGSRDKQRIIREIWASGKYSSRDICAEQECAALEMSFSAARRALRNTPDPSAQ